MRRPGIGLLVLAACGLYGAVALKAEDPIVPVYHEPHHRQVFKYGPTRILDLQIPPGAPRRGFTRTRRPSCTSTSRRREAARRIWARSGAPAVRQGQPPTPASRRSHFPLLRLPPPGRA